MSIFQKLRLQEVKVVEIINFMDKFAFDDSQVTTNYLEELALSSKIYGFHMFRYENPRFENLQNGLVSDDTALVADIDLESLPSLFEIAKVHKYFDFEKELADRIQKNMTESSIDTNNFDINGLKNNIEAWEPLWVVTYIWLLVSCRMVFSELVTFDIPSDHPLPTEHEAMANVLRYTAMCMTENG
ncbi:MAG: hypothetical protein J6N72_01775 [Psychrobacter sp.]|nr:hypothetical protein [Psychrobacter sp.]